MSEAVTVAAKKLAANRKSKVPKTKKSDLSPSINSPVEKVLFLQKTIGNRAVERLVKSGGLQAKLNIDRPGDISIQRRIVDEGKIGKASAEGFPLIKEAITPNFEEGKINEWGGKDGFLTSEVFPHIFVNNGKTGSGLDNTVGGPGGTGNQPVGSISLVAPVYESAGPTLGSIGRFFGARAKAWIRPGMGRATVTRSYTGSLVGANGPTLYMTAAAVTRTDQHEELHIASSRSIHDTHIVPLEARIALHTGQGNARYSGGTAAEAETELRNFIDWNATITAFQNADTAANTPMGTIDTADLASPTFIRDYGPRNVMGVNYAHYFDIPPGP